MLNSPQSLDDILNHYMSIQIIIWMLSQVLVKDKKEWTESIQVNYIQKYLLVSAGVRYLNP